jgi:HTH-type transcriptional regulator, glycine betaine synthesis regulator
MAHTPSKAKRTIVDNIGQLFQAMGLRRSVGQIYGVLFMSTEPLPLDELVSTLKISKGSASTGTRLLLKLNALKEVWVPGDRRPFFETSVDFSEVMATIVTDFFRNRLNMRFQDWENIDALLQNDRATGSLERGEVEFYRTKLKSLMEFDHRLNRIRPLLEKILLKP